MIGEILAILGGLYFFDMDARLTKMNSEELAYFFTCQDEPSGIGSRIDPHNYIATYFQVPRLMLITASSLGLEAMGLTVIVIGIRTKPKAGDENLKMHG